MVFREPTMPAPQGLRRQAEAVDDKELDQEFETLTVALPTADLQNEFRRLNEELGEKLDQVKTRTSDGQAEWSRKYGRFQELESVARRNLEQTS